MQRDWDWRLAQRERLQLLEEKLLTLIDEVNWFQNADGTYCDEGPAILKTLAETEEILRRIRAMSPSERGPNEVAPSRRITSTTPRHEPPDDLPGIGSG